MSKWWKIFPWKFGKGSVRQGCSAKPPAGAPTALQRWGSAWALVFYCLCRSCGSCEMSMCNLFAKSICCSGWWDPLSSFHLEVDAANLQPVSTPRLGAWTAFYLHVMIPSRRCLLPGEWESDVVRWLWPDALHCCSFVVQHIWPLQLMHLQRWEAWDRGWQDRFPRRPSSWADLALSGHRLSIPASLGPLLCSDLLFL